MLRKTSTALRTRIPIVLILAAAGLALGAPTAALAAPKASGPALPEVRFEKYELANGLDVILHEDHTLPVVAINVWYHVGSKNEKRGRTGFAHLFEHMMFQGSEHAADDFIHRIEEIGGDLNGTTNEDRTEYWENLPSNYLERGLWLEADRMGYLLPAMTQEKLDNQRDVVKNERRQGLENQPYNKAYDFLPGLLFPSDHPYSWLVIGSMEDLSAASLDDVSEFFKLYYTPNNASLCIAGDFDPAEAKRMVEKYFAPIPPGPPIDRVMSWAPALTSVKRMTVEDNVTLPKTFMLWHTPAAFAPGDAELDLFANALSSGKSSRLYQSLVYEKQIAQEITAYVDSREIGGLFTIEAVAREGHTLDELEAAIDQELRHALDRGLQGDEVARAKTAYEAGFVRGLERIGGFTGRAGALNRYNTYLGDPGRLEWDLARYTGATAADVSRAARAHIDLGRRVILRVVPQGDPAAAGDTKAMAAAPEPKPEPSFTPPAIQRARLSNGLDVLLVEDHDLPIVQANLVVRGGWAADPIDRLGTGSLTAELLDEGTTTKSALEISEAFRNLGAQFSSESDLDACEVHLNSLKKNLDAALGLMADVVLHPAFPADELERQRKIYLGRVQQESKEPFALVQNTFFKTVYGAGHPYGQPITGTGTEATLAAITAQDLVDYYRANFAPTNAAMVIAGDITMDDAVARLERAFRAWPAREVARTAVPDPKPRTGTAIYIVDKPGAPQSVILAGHPGIPRNAPDYAACQVMNNAFGGQFTSRINLNLREDKGYTYGAGSVFFPARGKGPFFLFAPVQTQNTKEALVEILKELHDVQGKRPLTGKEVADSKSNLVRSYPQEFQSLGVLANKMAQIVTYDLPDDEWVRYTRAVTSIDAATANEAAREHLHPDAAVIVIVGDREKIEGGIRALGVGEVVDVAARE
jgi:zinc protease